MKQVLFVCTGNSCRSVMAEGLFHHMTQGLNLGVTAASAGVSTMDGFPPSEETLKALDAEGIDMSAHASRALTFKMVEEAEQIYVMENNHRQRILDLCPEAEGKVFLLTHFSSDPVERTSDMDIPDPIRMSSFFYKNVMDVIRDCVGNIVKQIKTQQGKSS